jgi:hypothetical protein
MPPVTVREKNQSAKAYVICIPEFMIKSRVVFLVRATFVFQISIRSTQMMSAMRRQTQNIGKRNYFHDKKPPVVLTISLLADAAQLLPRLGNIAGEIAKQRLPCRKENPRL